MMRKVAKGERPIVTIGTRDCDRERGDGGDAGDGGRWR